MGWNPGTWRRAPGGRPRPNQAVADKDMMVTRNAIKNVLALIIVSGVVFFFCKSLQKHWASIRLHPLKLDYPCLVLSFVAILMTYLLSTYGWQLALNSLSGANKITFAQSIAAVNTSSLTKYIPGKVWSYALQMYWLADAGYSKSLIVYVNLANLFISIVTSLIIGLGYLLFSPELFARTVIVPVLILVVLFDFVFILFNLSVTNGLVSLFAKIFGREVKSFDISPALLVYLHLVHFLAALCFGLGGCLLCFGIGFTVAPGKMLLVMSSLLISDVIGFLAVIVPGGLGVREGVMYLMLNNVSPGAFALVLPIASRIVNMFADLVLGVVALVLLKRFIAATKTKENACAAQ
jgi:glycosyltransferase 2 family protein